jgi:peptidoglycan/xylan/chitin deacetylase (PgdA/CDA1 family)
VKGLLARGRTAAWAVRDRPALPPPRCLRVLTYHRVSDEDDRLAVRIDRFRDQLDILERLGARVVDIVTGVALMADPDDVPTVALTFDDAYRDLEDVVQPLLHERGFGGTMFVPTGIIDGTTKMTWYANQPPVLDWPAVRDLDREGTLRAEAHSVTHPNLTTLEEDALHTEIVGSRSELERQLGRSITAFCYPAGLFGDREVAALKHAGFELGVTSDPGLNMHGTDRFRIRRTQIDSRDNLVDFGAKLGGAFDRDLPLRRTWRRWRYGISPT